MRSFLPPLMMPAPRADALSAPCGPVRLSGVFDSQQTFNYVIRNYAGRPPEVQLKNQYFHNILYFSNNLKTDTAGFHLTTPPSLCGKQQANGGFSNGAART